VRLRVSVVYCTPAAWVREIELAAGSTLRVAIERSGVLDAHPDLKLDDLAVGVFSRPRQLGDVLHDGDRVEIYRPLLVDPKEARRHRAELRRKRKGEAKG
jgi:putative ubiquitin-RnfH superfamily antitoxin RatB of RatAB toxin-antitoxin module